MQEYVVGFRVFEGRSLQTEDGNPCDPFVVVECCDNVYQTETLQDRDSLAPWNETCIWPKIELYPKEFDSSFIEFKVYAKHWFTRNYLIGKASLQLSFINRRQNHLYARRLLSLRREDSAEILGMLCVTVYVLLPGEIAPSASLQVSDESVAADAEDQPEKDEEDNLQNAVLQTGIVPLPGKPHYLRLNIHRVEDLQDVSYSVGAPSPYVTVEFAGCLVKTQVGKNVSQHTFNECLQIPVTTPVYEDTVIMKLWHYSWMSSDVLLAQGLMSFSGLRGDSLPPKWFNLYGWSSEEVDDDAIVKAGDPEPNVFRGRVLISGYVERVGLDEALQPAKSVPARSVVEPQLIQLSILADVYMVAGVDGRQCQVEISFGSVKNSTKWVSYDTGSHAVESQRLDEGGDGEEEDPFGDEMMGGQTFAFNEKNGRVEPLLVMTPEDPDCQPFVMISLYAQGYVQGQRRVAFAKCSLEEFSTYEPSDPSKPRFVPMELVSGYESTSQASPSVLVAINWTKDLRQARTRTGRKMIKPMVYVLRAYCFMARNIQYKGIRRDVSGDHLGLKVNCAGVAQRTRAEPGPRVHWMQPLELRIVLSSDSRDADPASEPITLTLWGGGNVTTFDIGKAVCVYSKIRKKGTLAKWDPYHLMPQWIKLFGGPSGACVGEVLIAFELLLFRHRHEKPLALRDMWPIPAPLFDKTKHICSLRKATLHVSLLGLRDICPLPRLESLGTAGGNVHAACPSVTVQMVSLVNTSSGEMDSELREVLEEKLIFHFGDGATPETGKRHLWMSNAISIGQECTNFEFLCAGQMRVLVPDAMMFQPHILVRVEEQPSSMGASLGYKPTAIGEAMVGLDHLLPCCWLEGVSLEEPFQEQCPLIEKSLQTAISSAQAREKFRPATELELKMERERRNTQLDVVEEKQIALFSHKEEEAPYLDDEALPKPLRLGQRRPGPPQSIMSLNMQRKATFSPREGSRGTKGTGARRTVNGELEYSNSRPFKQDFWYRGLPLRRNQDILDNSSRIRNWQFQQGEVFGFVKCAFKLVDGWEGEDGPDGETTAIEDVPNGLSDVNIESDRAKLKRSYNFDSQLDQFAFDAKELYAKYRDPDVIPARIRVRIYFVKAVCMFGNGAQFADPFLNLALGKDIVVSMRNMIQPQTNTPEFYRVEERDIKMPEEARLEVTVKSAGSDLSLTDPVIGGTVIDLEDRWHSPTWSNSMRLLTIPMESRSLYASESPGRNCGSLEMWLEMVDSAAAADLKASLLAPPPQADLELRLVIWGASDVKMMDGSGDHTNVMVTTMLDCKEYAGEYQNPQSTDVHYNSKDGKAIFNWRMVYPRIKTPTWSCTLLISLYHHELTADTFIGSVNLDLKKYVEKVSHNFDALIIGPNDIQIMSSSDAQDCVGSVNMSLYVLSQPEADSKRAGIARDEPNEDPQLICPIEGRDWGSYLETFGFAWPDFGLWKKLIPLVIAAAVFLFAAVLMRQIGLF